MPFPLSRPLPYPLSLVSARVNTWAIESQQGARRNAMIASTAMAARRAEREDVEDFFSSLRPSVRPPARTPSLPVVAHR
jgi:hypothetical protein